MMTYEKTIYIKDSAGNFETVEISGDFLPGSPQKIALRWEDSDPGEMSTFDIQTVIYKGVDIVDVLFELEDICIIEEQMRREAIREWREGGGQ